MNFLCHLQFSLMLRVMWYQLILGFTDQMLTRVAHITILIRQGGRIREFVSHPIGDCDVSLQLFSANNSSSQLITAHYTLLQLTTGHNSSSHHAGDHLQSPFQPFITYNISHQPFSTPPAFSPLLPTFLDVCSSSYELCSTVWTLFYSHSNRKLMFGLHCSIPDPPIPHSLDSPSLLPLPPPTPLKPANDWQMETRFKTRHNSAEIKTYPSF